MNNFEFVGSIDFGEYIDITDPCYNRDVWCRMNSVRIEPGTYHCYVSFRDCEEWGIRVYAIAIAKRVSLLEAAKEEIGQIGVDAGLAGFFENKPDYTGEEWDKLIGLLGHEDNVFFSPNDEYISKGFFSSSGYGDGGYPVYCHRSKNGVPDALMIEYL